MKYIIFLFRAIWLALSLLILFFSMHRLSLLDSTRDVSELISLMSYGMMVICFPTGIVFFIALGNDSNLLIVFYVQIMPDDFVMQLHRF